MQQNVFFLVRQIKPAKQKLVEMYIWQSEETNHSFLQTPGSQSSFSKEHSLLPPQLHLTG